MSEATSERPASPGLPRARPVLVLRLYVAGNAPNSVRAVANARAICDPHYANAHHIEVVDVIEDTQRALADGSS